MGSSFGIKCNNCEYEKSFRLGIGMMYSPCALMSFDDKFSLLSLISSKSTKQYVRELINQKNGTISDAYGHTLYRCSKCGEFYERFLYSIDFDGGRFVPIYKCRNCNNEIVKVDFEKTNNDDWDDGKINLSKYHCPKCGKRSLAEDCSLLILWD